MYRQRFESVETIQKSLNLSRSKAIVLRWLVKDPQRFCETDEPNLPKEKWFPKTRKWYLSCYNNPKLVEVQEMMIDEHMGTYGVEALNGPSIWDPFYMDILYTYCNQGDPYTNTVIFDCRKRKFFIGCWGDIVERENL